MASADEAQPPPNTAEELSEGVRCRVRRDCTIYGKQHVKCLRKRPAAQCEREEMYELLLQCTALQGVCVQEGNAFRTCFKAIRGAGQYQGRQDCAPEWGPLQRCAAGPTSLVFGYALNAPEGGDTLPAAAAPAQQ
eukprot:TRINITY_DN28715_c0_g1_i2.p2 TRINITY_DN28715_c0_g1~~TRINITY_DN28715_c0_g1_i2.p2  ORF type:complete len:158 (+),score=49.68 TRINITY_DN28715_c0_g1_i2:70-474(+)